MSAAISVRPLAGRGDRRAFLELPRYLYADDPVWIPPLDLERRLHLSRFNPYFKHAEWQGWVAWRGDRPVGRITAQVDQLHRQRHGPDTGQFGMFECEDNEETAAALFRTAEGWLRQREVQHVTGPFNFSINQECGVLIEGFDTPPVIMMPHARPWYDHLLQGQGYTPARDLFAYWVNTDFEIPKVMSNLVARYDAHTRLRPLDRSNFAGELDLLRDIFNDAWSENWGFVPFTREEFAEIGTSLKLFVPEGFIQIAEVDGDPAAFIVVLPNLNEVFREINGRLLPLGWLHLIRRLRRHEIRTCRVPLMGVRKRYQGSPLGVALAFQVINEARGPVNARGIRETEMSWILEDNKAMRGILDAIGSRAYKRYRIYAKDLAGGS